MNKLFIGLLIVAAGAGVYFFVLKKKNSTTTETINKELIIGKWKAEDSVLSQYQYDFTKEGNLIRSSNDSVSVADTSHYEWNKKNELVWKEITDDSIGKTFSVVKLTHDSLQVRSSDSSEILFRKLK